MKPLFFLIFVAALYACTYDKAPQPKVDALDTNNVSYSAKVKSILSANCYSCHGTAVVSTPGGLDLESFTSLKSYLKNYYRNDGIYGSLFYHIILQSPGVIGMPPGADQLSMDEVELIKAWIDQGAQNN